jgi:hypothetical protein
MVVCWAALLGIYALMLYRINETRAEAGLLQERVNELERRNTDLYAEFCQVYDWLRECQLSIPPDESMSVEDVNNILKVKR